jgi:hypothetical protein
MRKPLSATQGSCTWLGGHGSRTTFCQTLVCEWVHSFAEKQPDTSNGFKQPFGFYG